ncbi:hypothetical protein GHT06_020313 [Daphnia sinensis]|uniref:Uncharacterized protein n=1 Tax=Daphnia sinensis TaxID=1820382 RepID=A0AAD5KL90_9CRUS|nr:hypothetical protein GHT06_020313 [Daphnia sinensis]
MSSQNFSRGSRNPRAEHVRVDWLTNGRFREADSWNNSRVFFYPNANRFVPNDTERFDRPVFRERSPLRRPRYEDPYVHYLDEGEVWGQPAVRDSYVRDEAAYPYGAYFECEHDPRSYPTHSEFKPEDESIYEDDSVEIDRGRPWRPQNSVRFVTEEPPLPVGKRGAVSGLPAVSDGGQATAGDAGPSGAGMNADSRQEIAGPSCSITPSTPSEQNLGLGNASGPPSSLIPKSICDEIPQLLSVGISTEQSKMASKEFPFTFEVPDFSLMPPKLDAWMSRRSKDRGVLQIVNAKEEALVRTQLKIMDIGPPLIDLYSKLSTVEEAGTSGLRRSVQAALKQWGRAFVHVSKKRRESIVNITDPRIEYLLRDDSCFAAGKEARELLFTGHREDGEVLEIPEAVADAGIPIQEVGARLRSFANHWRTVTDDPWVLDTVANGLLINFLSDPFQRSAPRDVAMSNEMRVPIRNTYVLHGRGVFFNSDAWRSV